MNGLRQRDISSKVDDTSSSIGRRYSRNDELGTPFAITIDFQTLNDSTVTLRERDSTRQVRGQMDLLIQAVERMVRGDQEWKDVESQFESVQVADE